MAGDDFDTETETDTDFGADTGAVVDVFADADDADDLATNPHTRIEAVLDDLAASGLLSDERTAETVRHSHSTRYGQHRLKQTLKSKGLDAELVQATLQRAQGTEAARALDVWRRRWGRPPADAAERARQQRFLAARGFGGDVIRQVMRHATQAAGAGPGAEDAEDAPADAPDAPDTAEP